MFKAITAYRLGKRAERLHEDAKTALFVKFTAIQQHLGLADGSAAIMMCFLFGEDLDELSANDLLEHRERIEPAVDEILRHDPNLKELLSVALFLKLNICRAYGNRSQYDKMLANPVFKKYCDLQFRLNEEGLNHLESLIAGTQSDLFR